MLGNYLGGIGCCTCGKWIERRVRGDAEFVERREKGVGHLNFADDENLRVNPKFKQN